VGRLAIRRIVDGYGYDLTGVDVIGAFTHFMAAAQSLGVATAARADVLGMVTEKPGAFAELLIRQCSAGG